MFEKSKKMEERKMFNSLVKIGKTHFFTLIERVSR